MRALAIVAVLAGTAHAESSHVKPPAGWRLDAEQATALAAKANAVTHFGGAPSLAMTQVFIAPDGPGVLYVTAVAGKVTDHRDESARVEIDSFLAAAKRATLSGGDKISVGMNASGVNARKKQIEIVLQWRDPNAGVENQAQLVVAADAENIVAVSGECVFSAETTASARDACGKALGTLDPGIPVDKRVELALAPDGTEPPPRPDAVPMATARPQATMNDTPQRDPLPPINVRTETKRTTDRRPVYVGFGIVVLAAVFWWNRRRRERFGAEEPNDDD